MKKQDLEIVLDNYTREELPSLISIDSSISLTYNIQYIERLVRSSDYYTIWREYLKRYEDATLDVIEQLDTKELSKTKIEIHHHPYTLYDVCEIVGLHLLKKNNITDPYEITKIVLEEHLLGNIGYCPLLITDHQKYHDNLIEISEDKIKGNYKEFIKKYTA